MPACRVNNSVGCGQHVCPVETALEALTRGTSVTHGGRSHEQSFIARLANEQPSTKRIEKIVKWLKRSRHSSGFQSIGRKGATVTCELYDNRVQQQMRLKADALHAVQQATRHALWLTSGLQSLNLIRNAY